MPLIWEVDQVNNYKKVTTVIASEDDRTRGVKKGDELWNPVTSALVWHSIGTGIPSITAENEDEVYARISLLESLYGASLVGPDGPVYISPEYVHQHIGMWTNASRLTRAQFLKQQAASYLDEKKRSFSRAFQDPGEVAKS